MITRDASQLQVVPGFVSRARFTGCAVGGFTCARDGATSAIGSSEFWPGFVIDRLGLSRNFNSVMVAPVVHGDYATTAGPNFAVLTLSVGLQHTCTTGGTWAALSTEKWLDRIGLWRQSTATSTANLSFAQVQRDVGLSTVLGIGGQLATATATAAGASMTVGTSSTSLVYYVAPGAVFDLSGAKRYVRSMLRLQHETTVDFGGAGSCGLAGGSVHMSAALVFGEPDEAQPPTTPTKRILVTSGCAS